VFSRNHACHRSKRNAGEEWKSEICRAVLLFHLISLLEIPVGNSVAVDKIQNFFSLLLNSVAAKKMPPANAGAAKVQAESFC
jgi:hypothetical protein